MKKWPKLLIIAAGVFVVLISFYFRARWLDISPYSIGFDEAALGYNAYSILETGKDEFGNKFPLSLASFNDYKPALYAYLSIPFIKFLGLNQISTRIVSSLAGTIIIIFTTLIGYYFFSKKLALALFVLLLAAVQPWGLHYSRTAFESNLMTAFFTAGVFFIFKKKGRKNELIAVILFALSMFSYHSTRVAAPLFLLLYLFILEKPKQLIADFFKLRLLKLSQKFFPLIILFLLTLPIWLSLKQGLILTRLKQENALERLYPYAPPELVNPQDIWSSFPANPLYYLSGEIVGHFFAYFSPINLGARVFHWVKNSPQNIASFSMLGWAESFFFLIGLLYLIKNLKRRENKIILAWIVSGIIPAIVTWTWFHPLRSLLIYPAMVIISALGMIRIFNLLPKTVKIITLFVFIPLLLMQASYVINNELVYNVYQSHGEYQPGGFKKGVPELAKIQDDYEKVVIETPHAQGYIFFLFYQSFPPELLQQEVSKRKPPGTEGDLSFDFYKYEFRKIYWPEDRNLKKTAFWGTTFSLPKEDILNTPGAKIIKESANVTGSTTAVIVVND
ncbi:MAG: hypothetical protein ABIH88_00180 [Patescibacteria group bacterium]